MADNFKLSYKISWWGLLTFLLLILALYHVTVFHPHLIPFDYLPDSIGTFLHYLAYEQHTYALIGYGSIYFVHIFESTYGFILTRRANMPVKDQIFWTILTFIFGFSSLLPLMIIVSKRRKKD